MADVSGVAGTGRLVAIASQVRGDPGALTGAAAAFVDAGNHAGDTAQLVGDRIGRLDGAWQGSAADAVVAFGASLRGAYDAVPAATNAVATALGKAADALDAAHTAVEALTDRVAAEVAAITVTDAPTHVTLVAQIVERATAEAETALASCVDTLQAATGEIGAASGTPLSSLPAVSAQPFQPGNLAPGDWSVQDAPASTSTQSVGAGPHGITGGQDGGGAPGSGASGSGASGGGGGVGGAHSGSASGHGDGGMSGGGDVGGGPPGGGGAPAAPEQVNRWIDEAIEVLRQQGVPVDQMSRQDIWTIISHESGGDPNAMNDWDSNAAAGTPSKGLMQTIGPTFDSYKLPGHDDIWNPVDNIIAGVRYSIDRYGSVSNVPGVTGVANGGGYVGY